MKWFWQTLSLMIWAKADANSLRICGPLSAVLILWALRSTYWNNLCFTYSYMNLNIYIWGYDVVLSTPEVKPGLRAVGQCNTFQLGDDWGLDGFISLLVAFLHNKHPPETFNQNFRIHHDLHILKNMIWICFGAFFMSTCVWCNTVFVIPLFSRQFVTRANYNTSVHQMKGMLVLLECHSFIYEAIHSSQHVSKMAWQ